MRRYPQLGDNEANRDFKLHHYLIIRLSLTSAVRR